MNRLILRALNAPGLIFIAIIAVALQSSLFQFEWIAPFQPDLLLFLVIWMALKRDFTEGGVMTLMLGYLAETQSAAPQGLFLTLYMTLYLLIRFFNKVMLIWTWLPLTVSMTAFMKLELLIILRLLDVSAQAWHHLLFYLVPQIMIHAILVKPLYRSLARYDIVTYKDLATIQAIESGLQPEDEGL